MRLSPEIANALPLNEAAQKAVGSPLLQMPHLVSERCLVNAVDQLANQTRARLITGYMPTTETIAMPKRGLGPRPIALLSPETRTLYHSLVDRLAPALPEPSRSKGLDAHRAFGTEESTSPAARIVDFDIAACYEYIDHGLLSEELTLQSLDPAAVGVLSALLSELFPRGIGIPQAMEPSHLLADAYLEQLVREMVRAGYLVARFADDFRIVAGSWGEAHEAIERSVEIARKYGLVLADGKTEIRSAQQIRSQLAEREAELQKYRDEAADEMRSIDYVQVDYDEFEMVETEADDSTIDFVALSRVVQDWVTGDREKRSVHAYFGSRALRVLQASPERVPDAWLVEIAEREPIRLLNIVNYLRARPESDENWSALHKLATMPRQSPWARLWIARVADVLEHGATEDEARVFEWAQQLLTDRYESVRAEAAWLLSGQRQVGIDRLAELYVAASDISRVGIAASAGRAEGAKSSKMGVSIRADSALTKSAYDWGCEHVD